MEQSEPVFYSPDELKARIAVENPDKVPGYREDALKSAQEAINGLNLTEEEVAELFNRLNKQRDRRVEH